MPIKFTKMQGLGNDYIFINCFEEKLDKVNLKDLAIRMSDRHFGIGSDGIILIMPPASNKNDFKYRIFNPDGSEAEMCGNGMRCAGRFVFDHSLTKKTKLRFETKTGIIIPEIILKNKEVSEVRVDMGEPILERENIPMTGPKGMVINESLKVEDNNLKISCVSMGNPHCIIFVHETEFDGFERLGRSIENHPLFPNKTNVEFIRVLSKNEIKMRVWERGTGETLACGTGACASAVASILNKMTDRTVTVHLKGGDLKIEWDKETNHVFMSGPAVEVFEGVW